MALNEYLGSIVMEVDGQEVEVESVDATIKTGRKLVKTMNRTGRSKGFAKGVAEYDLKVTVVIPLTGDINWEGIQGAKIRVYPLTEGAKGTTYQDCFTIDVGEKYQVDNEAKRDISMGCLNRVFE